MVNGGAEIQPDKNWTKVHNSILELLASTNFTARELRCLLFLLRMTYGYGCKEHAISLTEWEQGTNLRRGHISQTLQALTERRIILKTETGPRSKPVWAFNKYFEQWQPSTPLGTSFSGTPVGTMASTPVGTMASTPVGTEGSTPVQSASTHIKERKETEEERGKENPPARSGYFGMPVYERREKRAADGFILEAAKLGVDMGAFIAMVNLLIDTAKWRSLIDDLGQDDKLNFAKENAIQLIKLGNTTPEHIAMLIDAYKKANAWRGEVAPLPRQLTDYAGQLKDGLPQQNGRASTNGRGQSKVERSMAAVDAVMDMIAKGSTL